MTSWRQLAGLWVVFTSVTLAAALSVKPAAADEQLLMARSLQPFPETMLTLQQSITAHGYTVARVQRVDIGLSGAGYPTDKYRIVFYGKTDEIQTLSGRYPELVPFLPPSFSIFAEDEETIIVAMNPVYLTSYYKDPDLGIILARWESDVRSILRDIRAESREY